MTNIEHNHWSIIPVSRGIQLCASRMDSLSQLHSFKKEMIKIEYIRQNWQWPHYLPKKECLKARVNHRPCCQKHELRTSASPAFCRTILYYFTEHLIYGMWSIIPSIPFISNNFCSINYFFSHHSGHVRLFGTELTTSLKTLKSFFHTIKRRPPQWTNCSGDLIDWRLVSN